MTQRASAILFLAVLFFVPAAYCNLRPDRVPGVPVYLSGPQYPGGRILNFDAFQLAAANAQGDLPRNFARDFGAVQADLALRRDFPLSERLHLQFRAEAFNLFNRPNFSNIDNNLGDGPYDPVAHSGFGGAQRTPITRSAASTLFTKSADPARFN